MNRFEFIDRLTQDDLQTSPLAIMRCKVTLNGQAFTVVELIDKTQPTKTGWMVNGLHFPDDHPDFRQVAMLGCLCQILQTFLFEEARDLWEKFSNKAGPEIEAILKMIPLWRA